MSNFIALNDFLHATWMFKGSYALTGVFALSKPNKFGLLYRGHRFDGPCLVIK